MHKSPNFTHESPLVRIVLDFNTPVRVSILPSQYLYSTPDRLPRHHFLSNTVNKFKFSTQQLDKKGSAKVNPFCVREPHDVMPFDFSSECESRRMSFSSPEDLSETEVSPKLPIPGKKR